MICCRETGVKGPIPKAAAARAQYIPSPYMGTTTEGQPAARAAWKVPTQRKGEDRQWFRSRLCKRKVQGKKEHGMDGLREA